MLVISMQTTTKCCIIVVNLDQTYKQLHWFHFFLILNTSSLHSSSLNTFLLFSWNSLRNRLFSFYVQRLEIRHTSSSIKSWHFYNINYNHAKYVYYTFFEHIIVLVLVYIISITLKFNHKTTQKKHCLILIIFFKDECMNAVLKWL